VGREGIVPIAAGMNLPLRNTTGRLTLAPAQFSQQLCAGHLRD
jgi:hypothetical protein